MVTAYLSYLPIVMGNITIFTGVSKKGGTDFDLNSRANH